MNIFGTISNFDSSHQQLIKQQRESIFPNESTLSCIYSIHFVELNRHLCIKLTRKWRNFCIHDDVIKWKHFPRYWPFVRGVNTREAADSIETLSRSLWRHRNDIWYNIGHWNTYDILTLMILLIIINIRLCSVRNFCYVVYQELHFTD